MGTVKVNTDLFCFTVPAAEAGKAPEPRMAYRGEVIDLDGPQERRGRATIVNRDYPVAPGSNQTVRAQEPALVDVDFDEGGAAIDAAKRARATQLRAELAALNVDEPLGDGPLVAGGDGDDGGIDPLAKPAAKPGTPKPPASPPGR